MAEIESEREIALVLETATDLARMCADPAEARRYFVVSERAEVEENEFNLNLQRYVDTFKPEQEVAIADAMAALNQASGTFLKKRRELKRLLKISVARQG